MKDETQSNYWISENNIQNKTKKTIKKKQQLDLPKPKRDKTRVFKNSNKVYRGQKNKNKGVYIDTQEIQEKKKKKIRSFTLIF